MTDDKKLILKMLKEGKITEEEAIMLLDSIQSGPRRDRKNNQSEFETSILDKIGESFAKFSKSASDMINSFDFDDFALKYNSNYKSKSETERVVSADSAEKENIDLEISNRDGKIEIYTWDNDTIEARANVVYNDKFVPASSDFIKIEEEDEKIIIKPDFAKKNERYFNLNLTVILPKKLFRSLKVNSTNSNIIMRNIKAEDLLINSTNSRININDINAKTARIESTNARIYLEDIEGENLEIETTNGKIDVVDVSSNKVNVKTTNGAININTVKPEVESLDLKSFNGNISVNLGEITKPIKAKASTFIKTIDTNNISNSLFTNYLTEDNMVIAFTDGYDENEDRLDINADTHIGSVNIK